MTQKQEAVPAAEVSSTSALPVVEYQVWFDHYCRDPLLMPNENIEATDYIGVWRHVKYTSGREGAALAVELAAEVGGTNVRVFSRTVTVSRTDWKAAQL